METVQLAYDVYETEETQAEKCPIILLHGLFWNKHMFSKQAKSLCLATKRKVFCVDLRCHDQSPFREECSTELMAEDLKRFIKEKDLAKVVFVCHSFSSTAAYLVALDQPDTVEKMVMVDHLPFLEYTDEIYEGTILPQFLSQNRFLSSLDPSLSLLAAKKKILSMGQGASSGQKIFLQKIVHDLTKVKNQFKWKTDNEFLSNKYHEKFFSPPARGSSNHEILIIACGNSKRVKDEMCDDVIRFNPNAKFVVIEDSTHLVMFEKQDEFVAAVEEFLT